MAQIFICHFMHIWLIFYRLDRSITGLILVQILHTKLNESSGSDSPCASIKSATLYDGSITEFDSRLHGFDIGTCLEVLIMYLLIICYPGFIVSTLILAGKFLDY